MVMDCLFVCALLLPKPPPFSLLRIGIPRPSLGNSNFDDVVLQLLMVAAAAALHICCCSNCCCRCCCELPHHHHLLLLLHWPQFQSISPRGPTTMAGLSWPLSNLIHFLFLLRSSSPLGEGRLQDDGFLLWASERKKIPLTN